jgi:hypothetical protein
MKRRGGEAPVGRPEKKRWGVFLKAAVICVVLAFVCVVGGLGIIVLQGHRYNIDLPWFDPAERAFRILCVLFIGFGSLCKIAAQIFEQD